MYCSGISRHHTILAMSLVFVEEVLSGLRKLQTWSGLHASDRPLVPFREQNIVEGACLPANDASERDVRKYAIGRAAGGVMKYNGKA